MISVHFQGKPFNITEIQVYVPTRNAEEAEIKQIYEDLQDLLELTPPKDVPFLIEDCNAKVRTQEIAGVTGKFSLGVQNEAGQRLRDFFKRTQWSSQTPSSNNTRENFTNGHHQVVKLKSD